MRRSLTITPENERRIQGLRSTTLGLETPVDLDYTTATNMLVDLGFLTLERVGGLPENSLVPLVPLPLEDVIRLLFEYIADAVIKDLVQDKDQWAEEFSKKNAGVELLRSLRNHRQRGSSRSQGSLK